MYITVISKTSNPVPEGYFDDDNVEFVKQLVLKNLSIDFKNDVIIIPDDSVKRIMLRVLQTRVEDVPEMNVRAIMELTNEVRVHQMQLRRHAKFEHNFVSSRMLYDTVGQNANGVDVRGLKISNRLGKPRVGGTIQFYST